MYVLADVFRDVAEYAEMAYLTQTVRSSQFFHVQICSVLNTVIAVAMPIAEVKTR